MNDSWPLVYILLLNWNTEKHTLTCLASLQAISYPNYKIIVLDNASCDGSADAIAAAFPDVPVIRLGHNRGFTGASNVGFQHALQQGAQYIYLLNVDTRVAPDFLSEAVKTAVSDPSIGIVGSKVLHAHRPERLQFVGLHANLTTGYNGRPLGYDQVDNGQYDYVTDVDLVGGCTMMVSRACLGTVGGFDDAFFAFKEDFDLCLRAQAAGFRVVMSPLSRVWHEGGGSLGGGVSATHIYYSVRNGIRLVEKHKPAPNTLTSLARASCIAGAHLGQVLLSGPSRAALREIVFGVHDHYRGVGGIRPNR